MTPSPINFENEAECDVFFKVLNCVNPALKFTCEKEFESIGLLGRQNSKERQ